MAAEVENKMPMIIGIVLAIVLLIIVFSIASGGFKKLGKTIDTVQKKVETKLNSSIDDALN